MSLASTIGKQGKETMASGTYCFDVDAFAKEDFQVAAFLEECRLRNPMETIHQDLKELQTSLENQLVAIMNEDYAEFLQLSSQLKGVDEAVSSVRAPILAILQRVEHVQHMIAALQQKIHGDAQRAEELRKSKDDLLLGISVYEKVMLLEDLLDIAQMDTSGGDASEEGDPLRTVNSDTDESDDEFDNYDQVKRAVVEASTSEACAILERATQVWLQLEVEFLEGVEIPVVQRVEKRLAVIEETLLRRLETEFAAEIAPDTFYNRDHSINATTLSYLLRSYVLLQKTQVPEEMITRLLVQPFAEEYLTRGKLDGRTRGSCEGLQQIYDEILGFITHKFQTILQLPVCKGEAKCSVDILGNAIWKPLYSILSFKHSAIFTTADPDRFHRNYTSSMRFLAEMEKFCGTEAMILRFRTHESVVDFQEKWNMDVYFELRHNALSSALIKSFDTGRESQAAGKSSGSPRDFAFPSTRQLWETLSACWSDSVYLDPLLPEFAKLCLQLLVHYVNTWNNPLLEVIASISSSSTRSVSPSEFVCIQSEKDVVYVGNDFHILHARIRGELMPMMAQRLQAVVEDHAQFVQDLLDETLCDLNDLEDKCWSAVGSLVTSECKKVLPALRTVKGQYQMTNKPAPTTSSTYVANIIRPLEEFLERWGMHFQGQSRQDLLQSILDPVCALYFTLSSDLLKSAQELEESLKSRHIQRNLAVHASGSNELSDTEKMRMQLHLDLNEFHRIVKVLEFDLEVCPSYQDAKRALAVDA